MQHMAVKADGVSAIAKGIERLSEALGNQIRDEEVA